MVMMIRLTTGRFIAVDDGTRTLLPLVTGAHSLRLLLLLLGLLLLLLLLLLTCIDGVWRILGHVVTWRW